MNPRLLATTLAGGRLAIGIVLSAAPESAGARWVGADAERPGATVFTTGLGMRDAAVGLGGLLALQRGRGATGWLLAGALGDLGDTLATLRARDGVPHPGLSAAVAGGSALAGLALAVALRD